VPVVRPLMFASVTPEPGDGHRTHPTAMADTVRSAGPAYLRRSALRYVLEQPVPQTATRGTDRVPRLHDQHKRTCMPCSAWTNDSEPLAG